jgi:hypothetical protein
MAIHAPWSVGRPRRDNRHAGRTIRGVARDAQQAKAQPLPARRGGPLPEQVEVGLTFARCFFIGFNPFAGFRQIGELFVTSG